MRSANATSVLCTPYLSLCNKEGHVRCLLLSLVFYFVLGSYVVYERDVYKIQAFIEQEQACGFDALHYIAIGSTLKTAYTSVQRRY